MTAICEPDMAAALRESFGSSVRFLTKLGTFLRHPLSAEECRAMAEEQVRTRMAGFLDALQSIYARQESPYRKLLHHAGIAFSDLEAMVHQQGIEPALLRLYGEGVYVSMTEFKGRSPIVRGSLRLEVRPEDFYNPVLSRDYETRTASSSGVSTRLINFDHIAQRAIYHSLFLEAFDLFERPFGQWRPIPPPTDGFRNVLSHLKLGRPVARWFTQNPLTRKQPKFLSALAASRLYGRPIPIPQHVPLRNASRIAAWLAAVRERGTPAWLDTNASSAVRICVAAGEGGLNIAGTFFRVGGEPFTPAKGRIIAGTGSTGACHYTMSELGRVGMACAAAAELDEVHMLTDKLAAIQLDQPVGTSGLSVGALYLTTVRASAPSIMLNVETGDHGVLEERSCGCLLDRLGFRLHLRRIRSYGKLTSEGMTFLGDDLLALVEEVLPGHFGGNPTHYQFVEEEEGGLARMSVIVSRAVGAVDEEAVINAVLEFLATRTGGRRMTERWRAGQTLRVVRREPYRTGTAKILPLHVLPPGGSTEGR